MADEQINAATTVFSTPLPPSPPPDIRHAVNGAAVMGRAALMIGVSAAAMLLWCSTLLLPALVPALADGLRGLFARFTNGKGAQPASVTEQIQLMQAHTERVRALAELDALSPSASPWVANLRGAFRYVAVGSILLTTMASVLAKTDPAAVAVLLELSGASMSFIIGERMYLGLRK